MKVKARGFIFSLDQKEKNFMVEIIDFVDAIAEELFNTNAAVPPDDLLAALTDLRENARKLKDNEFYNDGD